MTGERGGGCIDHFNGMPSSFKIPRCASSQLLEDKFLFTTSHRRNEKADKGGSSAKCRSRFVGLCVSPLWRPCPRPLLVDAMVGIKGKISMVSVSIVSSLAQNKSSQHEVFGKP